MGQLRLFEGVGIELEYMIVDAETLDARPMADLLLRGDDGRITGEVERDGLRWSNELAAHLVELKIDGPTRDLREVAPLFQRDIRRINRALSPRRARLLPTGMHPWMNPRRETVLWPHDGREIYDAFHRIFDCRAHGWANLQSMQINLPFQGDDEFGRLHAAVRLILPILPALAASSPFMDGGPTGTLDNRLHVYRTNCDKIPAAAGRVIPEPVYTEEQYRREVLEPLRRDLAPHDPDGVLDAEWVNARGAIARFDRSAIEIRLIDTQECIMADLAVAALTIATVRALVEERWSKWDEQKRMETGPLARMLSETIRDADRARVDDAEYLALFNISDGRDLTAGRLWSRLRKDLLNVDASRGDGSLRDGSLALDVILEQGPLARRMLAAAGPHPVRERLDAVYRDLADCLEKGRMYEPR